jgi:hypothetical protein
VSPRLQAATAVAVLALAAGTAIGWAQERPPAPPPGPAASLARIRASVARTCHNLEMIDLLHGAFPLQYAVCEGYGEHRDSHACRERPDTWRDGWTWESPGSTCNDGPTGRYKVTAEMTYTTTKLSRLKARTLPCFVRVQRILGNVPEGTRINVHYTAHVWAHAGAVRSRRLPPHDRQCHPNAEDLQS